MRSVSLASFLGLLVWAGCGGNTKNPVKQTLDGGGFNTGGDDNLDQDADGYTPANGDCNDHDADIRPGADELCDGKDNDCNKVTDDPCDNDGDGYTVAGDKGDGTDADCNDSEKLVNPGAFEVVGNMLDDNCDGNIDEATAPCDGVAKPDAMSFAGAIELCAPWIAKATWNASADAMQRKVSTRFGSFYKPKGGKSFIVLSSGVAADENDPGYMDPQPGTEFTADTQNPLPMNVKNNVCGLNAADEVEVHDYAELKLTLKVPTNAQSFSFQFAFFSSEYPEWVGSEFNDKFLAILDSQSFKGNISYDKKKNPITVNVGFFDACDSAPICDGAKTNTCSNGKVKELDGTGYELDDGDGTRQGGGTGWLTTTSPVTPGETATLRFVIFDEGDHILDSAVVIDNFQWQLQAAEGPETIQ